jgi:hypothetical protein
LGIGDWGLGIGPNPHSQSPIPNPQSPIPNPHIRIIKYLLYKLRLNKKQFYHILIANKKIKMLNKFKENLN